MYFNRPFHGQQCIIGNQDKLYINKYCSELEANAKPTNNISGLANAQKIYLESTLKFLY